MENGSRLISPSLLLQFAETIKVAALPFPVSNWSRAEGIVSHGIALYVIDAE